MSHIVRNNDTHKLGYSVLLIYWNDPYSCVKENCFACSVSDVAGCLESVKAASEVFSPVGGVVIEVNKMLSDKPSLVNSSPFGNGKALLFFCLFVN